MRRAAFPVLLTPLVVVVAGCGAGHPVVPLRVQRTIEQDYPGKAYFPTRLPHGYRYYSWGHAVGLYDLAFVKTDASGKVVGGITFSVNPTPYVAPGLEGANPNEAFQINRHTEYWVGSAHYDPARGAGSGTMDSPFGSQQPMSRLTPTQCSSRTPNSRSSSMLG